MALPDRSPIPLGTSGQSSRPAFLVQFPQDVWEQIIASNSGDLQVSHKDAKLSLVLPDRTIGLDAQSLNPTEIYELSSSLNPLGLASTRLSVPYALTPSVKTPESARMRNGSGSKDSTAQNRQPALHNSASKLRNEATVPLARSHSSPGVPSASSAGAGAPVVPLKTRVVQHLALGAASVEEIVGCVGGAETDVMRVVKVVGRQVAENPPKYSLQPSQYTKIKLVDWRYTPEEQAKVGQLAREAFDELEFPEGSDERVELERKLEEAAAIPQIVEPPKPIPVTTSRPTNQPSTSSSTSSSQTHPIRAASSASAQQSTAASTSASSSKPQASGSVSAPSKAKKGPVAREMAKFRAEQARSSSAPGLKGTNGLASPRTAQAALPTAPNPSSKPVKKRAAIVVVEIPKEKVDRSDSSEKSSRSGVGDSGTKGKIEKKRKRERMPSPSFTSSEEEEDGDEADKSRGRAKQRLSNPASSIATSTAPPLSPTTKPIPMPSFQKRKSPPIPLEFKHQPKSTTPSTVSSERPDDPEDLRDRYEELYPAYQLLTRKLMALHQTAEGVEVGDGEVVVLPSKGELEKMVGKWERWHKELSGIRRWFGTGG